LVPTILSGPFDPTIRRACAGPANVRMDDAMTAATKTAPLIRMARLPFVRRITKRMISPRLVPLDPVRLSRECGL
jgi:hypothetical protein